jgi:hypothetical protein
MDRVLDGFLEEQWREASALAARSSVLTLVPGGGSPPDRYVARFACRTLVREPGGAIVEAEGFEVGIRFPPDYLRRKPSLIEVISFMGPANAFLPNVGPGPGGRTYLCIGEIYPQTPLVDLLLRCYEIASGQHLTTSEGDALNHEACAWARANPQRFPSDPRTMLGREPS